MTTLHAHQLETISGGYAECRFVDPINPITGTGPTFPTILVCD